SYRGDWSFLKSDNSSSVTEVLNKADISASRSIMFCMVSVSAGTVFSSIVSMFDKTLFSGLPQAPSMTAAAVNSITIMYFLIDNTRFSNLLNKIFLQYKKGQLHIMKLPS